MGWMRESTSYRVYRGPRSGSEDPYSTLVIFLSATGLRIGEAVGIKWSDFEGADLGNLTASKVFPIQSHATAHDKARLCGSFFPLIDAA